MSLILATGSNVGDSVFNLNKAKEYLLKKFKLISESRIYKSEPVEYLKQDDFFNQVLEFKIPDDIGPNSTFKYIKNIENLMGREKKIEKGPRNIDIDIIFWDYLFYESKNLVIPHHSWSKRSFVVEPLKELPFYEIIKKHYEMPLDFESWAKPIEG